MQQLRAMRADFQVLAPLVRNPLFPIEPFATYGEALDHVYTIISRLDSLEGFEKQLLSWSENPANTTILPVARNIFSWLHGLDSSISQLFSLLEKQLPDSEFQNISIPWKNLLSHEDTWLTLLGKDHPIRILLLNQNSDELRAGGGFPGTAFIIEFDDGKMTRFQFYDIYALDWNLT